MRPLIKYGIPAAAGLAAGGYAYSQGEDPGSAALAGLGGAAGGAAGLLAAGRLAGKYNPSLIASAQKQVTDLGNRIGATARNLPEKGLRRGAANVAADVVNAVDTRMFGNPDAGVSAAIPFPTQNVQRNVGRGLAAGFVPGASALAGLGGLAAGGGLGEMSIPGFQQQQYVDPESYGSSNTRGARAATTTLQYM